MCSVRIAPGSRAIRTQGTALSLETSRCRRTLTAYESAGDAVSGVPVYLEPYEPLSRRRVSDLRSVRTDMRGQYRFEGLAPGTYRILSTFEYLTPDVETMDIARALPVTVDTRNELSRDVDLYVIQ